MAKLQRYAITVPSREREEAVLPTRRVSPGELQLDGPSNGRPNQKMPTRMENARKKKRNHISSPYRSSSCVSLSSGQPRSELVFPTCESEMPTASAIKTNPLVSLPSRAPASAADARSRCSGAGEKNGAGSDVGAAEEWPVFYGQRRNIRKTKEREMICAISQLAQYGEKTYKTKRRQMSLLEKVRALSGYSPLQKRNRFQTQSVPLPHQLQPGSVNRKCPQPRKAVGGPFILRPRPPLKISNAIHDKR